MASTHIATAAAMVATVRTARQGGGATMLPSAIDRRRGTTSRAFARLDMYPIPPEGTHRRCHLTRVPDHRAVARCVSAPSHVPAVATRKSKSL